MAETNGINSFQRNWMETLLLLSFFPFGGKLSSFFGEISSEIYWEMAFDLLGLDHRQRKTVLYAFILNRGNNEKLLLNFVQNSRVTSRFYGYIGSAFTSQ